MSAEKKQISSPLRYPGSKKRLTGYIEEILALNDLDNYLFVEPFAGGANVSLYLLQNNLVDSIGLIERDPLVASFWQIVFSKNEKEVNWLIEQIRTIDIDLQNWIKYKNTVPDTKKERALACLFLNRTSFSGILAPSSGPIGGYSQSSQYKIDCRFPRAKLITKIKTLSKLRDKVKFVWNLHWKNGLTRIKNMKISGRLNNAILFYFDPPFFHQADRLYRYFFQEKDHKDLKSSILKIKSPWILSYDYCDEVKGLYGNESLTRVELLYSASQNGGSKSAQEVIISNIEYLPAKTKLWRSTEEWKNGKT
ncbi:DNA-methyltransferase [hydrothermal vent metagenome]|uniref:DNA-methyltransferase n=1 Tax=hydrothermal vent metagenome TaxID=652676 RepID=A0A3B0VYQ7_9ZZZZ